METTTSLKTFEVTIPEKYADILKKFITSLEGKVKAQKKSGLDEALGRFSVHRQRCKKLEAVRLLSTLRFNVLSKYRFMLYILIGDIICEG